MTRAVVALGSNLGDRAQALDAAVAALRALPSLHIVAVSRWFDSIPHTLSGADPGQPAYLNGVLLLETDLDARGTLAALQAVETELGRPNIRERWSDRVIDLDLIVFGDEHRDGPELTLPHPRAHERVFVLQPWLDLDPDATIPGRGRVAELLQCCPADERRALSVSAAER